MAINSLQFNLLKKQVLSVAGLKDIVAADCKALSVQIFKVTGRYLSETTVKRIYGFAQAKFDASSYTKSVLVQFCGYTSWGDYTMKTDIAVQNLRQNVEPSQIITTLKTFFDTTPTRILLLKAIYDKNGQIRDFQIDLINQAMEAIIGRTNLLGKLCCEQFPGIKKAGLYQLMLQVMQTGEPRQLDHDYPYEGFDGRYCSMFVKTAEGLLTIHWDSATLVSQESSRFII